MGQHFISNAVTVNKTRDVKVWWLINDLAKTVQLLDCDILTEEERTLIFDPQNVAYPPLARSLRTRRDNLKETIATLEAGATRVLSSA